MPRRMRDLRGRLAAAGLALALLAGCAAGQQPASTAAPSPAAPNAQTRESADAGQPLAFAGSGGMGNDNGFYFRRSNADWTGLLCYADYATRQVVPLCARPNCPHRDESCTAWLDDAGSQPCVLLAGQRLVLVTLGGMTDAPAAVAVAEPDGRDRHTIHAFAPQESVQPDFAVGGGALYLVRRTASAGGNPQSALVRVDLESGAAAELYVAKPGDSLFLVGCTGGRLLLKQFAPDPQWAGTAGGVQHQQHILSALDPATGRMETVCQWQQGQATALCAGDATLLATADHTLTTLDGTVLARHRALGSSCACLWVQPDGTLWLSSDQVREAASGLPAVFCVRPDGTAAQVPVEQAYGTGSTLRVLGGAGGRLFVELSDAPNDTLRYALAAPEQLLAGLTDADWFAAAGLGG